MSSAPILAWHFLPVDRRLRVDSPIHEHRGLIVEQGQVLTCDPSKLALCSYGLHASERAIDALEYAPGPVICRVECDGRVGRGDDKLVCSERRVLWVADATEALRAFARWSALRAVRAHWPEAPRSSSLRATAWDAARAATAAATAAAGYARAAWAAWDAAWDAEREAQAAELERALLALAPIAARCEP